MEELSIWNLCVEGGWIMIPIALLALVCIYILIERAIVIRKATRTDDTFMKRIRDYIHEGEIESALNLCRSNQTPMGRLIAKGISRIGRPMNDVLVAIENTGNLEVADLSKGLPWLATTAAGAPMLGFLGTVVGMVQAFYSIAASGNAAQIGTFAGGIYTAPPPPPRGRPHRRYRRTFCLQLSGGTHKQGDETHGGPDNGVHGPAQRTLGLTTWH